MSGGGGDLSGLTGNFTSNILDFAFMALPRFDNSMGTLSGVQLTYATTYSMGIYEAGASDTFEEGGTFGGDHNDAGISAHLVGSFYLQLFDPSSSSMTVNKPALDTDCYTQVRARNGDSSCVAPNIFDSGAINGSLPIGGLGLLAFIGSDPINLLAQVTGNVSGTCDSNDDGNPNHDQDVCWITSYGVGWGGNV